MLELCIIQNLFYSQLALRRLAFTKTPLLQIGPPAVTAYEQP